MRIIIALFFVAFSAAAQTPQVPHKMQFAGMTLSIRDDARREIQKDVNALTQSPRHHMIKVERARTYFPIIEKVFQEESVPDDFKYLVLQESALIADAVSVSNAVGFWQFKDYTAVEMGLRVDKEVDERLNIVSSSRAAARYIKKNNNNFDNWIYALQAYQMGAGGVMKSVRNTDSGGKHMEITSGTYWYVKKFLAHKIAFEGTVGSEGQIKVVPYENTSKKLLADLAREISVDETELKLYNKWAKTGSIPGDRSYTVIIPVQGEAKEPVLPATTVATATTPSPSPARSAASSAAKDRTRINGISAIRANGNETPAQLASRAGVDLDQLLKWNDISRGVKLQTEQYYLLGKKRVRAKEAYHKVSSTDNLWTVSQQYGVQLRKLKRYNRISSDRDLHPGMTLWLSSMKPKDADKKPEPEEIIQVDDNAFAWAANPDEPETKDSEKPQLVTESKTISVTPAETVPVASPASESAKPADNELGRTLDSDSTVIETETVAAPVAVTPTLPTPPPADQTPLDSVGSIKVVVPPAPKITKKEHVVQLKETLYAIANQYGLGVMDLVNWNSLNLQDGIKPGQILRLTDPDAPANERVETKMPEVEHVVKSTDTLYSVARKYNVTIKELMEWNGKKDFNLSVGEKLKVKSK